MPGKYGADHNPKILHVRPVTKSQQLRFVNVEEDRCACAVLAEELLCQARLPPLVVLPSTSLAKAMFRAH
jgi:hypothetical protein